MSTRSTYPPGVPCWVAQLSPDIDVSRQFYAAVFGWTFDNVAGEADPPFLIASVRGDRVASLAGPVDSGTWITAVAVADLAAARRAVAPAGGSAPGDSVEIATLGHFHRLEDPAGTEVHIAQLFEGRGAVRRNEPSAWSMSSLRVADPSLVTPFYLSLFGWEAEEFGPVTLFRLSGYLGEEPDQPVLREVVATMEQVDADPVWRPDFWVDDTDAAAETALARGGQVIAAPADTDLGFRTAVLADPTGGTFSVSRRST